MAEWTNARLLKSRETRVSVGSNPTPSAGWGGAVTATSEELRPYDGGESRVDATKQRPVVVDNARDVKRRVGPVSGHDRRIMDLRAAAQGASAD